ncbi:MAG: type II/IV secretion system protein [Candidatus Omnitrophica bacterium]|nr:type II/IV secretion system protein [Candidatus Omnitrophota bacterium]
MSDQDAPQANKSAQEVLSPEDIESHPLIQALLNKNLINGGQVADLVEAHQSTHDPLDKLLVDKHIISEEQLGPFLATQMDIPFIDLKTFIIEPEVLATLPEALARKYNLVPLFRIKDSLTLAMVDPLNVPAIEEVQKVTGCVVDTMLANRSSLLQCLDQHYGTGDSMEELVEITQELDDGENEEGFDASDVQKMTDDPPLIRLVNLLLLQAIDQKASDIHIEPTEKNVRVRFRLDGILHEAKTLPKNIQFPVTARLKIMSEMDTIERRKPQDGRISIRVRDRGVDLRVSTFPTGLGEKIVMRILDKSGGVPKLTDLGFQEDVLETFNQLIKRPNGIILVTGPTGSGKTSTLYSALDAINTVEINIMTLEDPVEAAIPGLNQGQVNPKVGMTFSAGLRSILRQDPNVVLVGEIRDDETAEIAIRASLTGHLVFSTLHTNDAPSAITRLIDIGVKPYLVSSSVLGILAQRLVRKVCVKCAKKGPPDEKLCRLLGIDPKKEFSGEVPIAKGCEECHQTGYKGRMGLMELFVPDEKSRRAIVDGVDDTRLKADAVERLEMKTLKMDGIEKVRLGFTTLSEVLTATSD